MGVSTPADGSLFAVGGYDSSSHLSTVEKYEPQVRNTLGPRTALPKGCLKVSLWLPTSRRASAL